MSINRFLAILAVCSSILASPATTNHQAACCDTVSVKQTAACDTITIKQSSEKAWTHGKLQVSQNGRYFCHPDSTPFFWLADTGWLLPQKLDRKDAAKYLSHAAEAGYNVVQVQMLRGVPTYNIYEQPSHPNGHDYAHIDTDDNYGYWDHIDYIVDLAAENNIYIGMVCVWGGVVKHGDFTPGQAREYGRFLAGRYGSKPNIVWIIGGDIRGDVKPEVWTALAEGIKEIDSNHLMTFHPFGRTNSVRWWNNASWLDFNMFQSGHRAYDQIKGDGDDRGEASLNEDNWRYVEESLAATPLRPVIDGEPSYEDIPQGLHFPELPRWQAGDVRRYAYWSVFAGAAGHTYGNNCVMQMLKPGENGGYSASRPWFEAINDEGYNQMKHLRALIEKYPFFERVPDQSVILGENGLRYDRAIATRGPGYILVYSYTDRPVSIDLSSLGDQPKQICVFDPRTGVATPLLTTNESTFTSTSLPDLQDRVYIATVQ